MNKSLTEIAYILDRSGSMGTHRQAAIAGYNDFLQQQKKVPGQANLSLVLFSTDCTIPETATPISEAPELTAETYIRLPDPPSRVGTKLEPQSVLESFCSLRESDVSLLDEINQRQPSHAVFFCDGNHKAKVSFHKFVASAVGLFEPALHLVGVFDVCLGR